MYLSSMCIQTVFLLGRVERLTAYCCCGNKCQGRIYSLRVCMCGHRSDLPPCKSTIIIFLYLI